MDTSLFTLVNTSHAPWLDDLMLLASAVGRAGFVWWVTALVAMVFPRSRMAAWRLILAVALAYFVVDGVIKPVIDRDRPFEALPEVRLIDQRPVSGSFPSGHAAAAFAGALAAGRLFPRGRVVWWALAVTIALSRVYVGAHWPSDVLSGTALGLAVGWFVLGGRQVPPRDYPEGDVARPDERRSSA